MVSQTIIYLRSKLKNEFVLRSLVIVVLCLFGSLAESKAQTTTVATTAVSTTDSTSSSSLSFDLFHMDEIQLPSFSKYSDFIETALRQKFLSTILLWYGTPYKWGGIGKGGIDCSGLTCAFYRYVYGTRLPRTSREQYRQVVPVEKEKLNEGDLVFFAMKDSSTVTHVGIYLGNNKFLHASCSRGVRIDSLKSNYFSKRYVGGGKVKAKTLAR